MNADVKLMVENVLQNKYGIMTSVNVIVKIQVKHCEEDYVRNFSIGTWECDKDYNIGKCLKYYTCTKKLLMI